MPVPSEFTDSTTPTLKAQGILEKRVKRIVNIKWPRKMLSLLRERKGVAEAQRGRGGEI